MRARPLASSMLLVSLVLACAEPPSARVVDGDRGATEASELLARGEREARAATREGYARAIPHLDAALTVQRQRRDPLGLGAAALARASVAEATGALGEARARALEARDAFDAARDRRGWAAATILLATIEKETGEAEASRALAEDARREAEALGDALLVARAEVRVAHALIDLDRPAEAQAPLEHALSVAERHGDRALEALALGQLGWLHMRRGDRDETLKAFTRMVAVADALGDLRLRGKAQHNLGGVHSDFDRDYATALPYFHRAIELVAASGDRAGEAYSLDAAGEMESSIGDVRAIARHERALGLRREVGALRGEAQTLTSLGSAHTRLGKPELAIEPLKRAAEIFVRIGDRTWEAYAYFRVARAEYARARWTEAMGWAQRALDITESLRGRIASDDGRAYYSASVRWYFDVYVASAARLHRATGARSAIARALEISEQARARSLVDMMSLVEAELPSAPPEVIDRLRALKREVRTLDRDVQRHLASGTGTPEALKALEAALAKAIAEHEALMTKASAIDPEGASLVAAPLVTLDEVQRELIDDRTVVLEYHLGAATGSWVLSISTSTAAAWPLESESVIDQAARRLHRALSARNERVAGETSEARRSRIEGADRDVDVAAREVTRLVLTPAARALAGKERLLVVADGALHYVPFAILPLPGSDAPVLSQLSVTTTPSLTVLGVVRRAKRRAPSLGLTVLADPIFERDDPRLRPEPTTDDDEPAGAERAETRPATSAAAPEETLGRLGFARAEAEAITQLGGPSTRLVLDADATRARALSTDVRGARLVHFATHGVLDTAHPERSGLVFSRFDARGAPIEGHLRLADIYDLELSADVVTLSACETALGREVRSEGLLGLSRGFLHAGAKNVVASLWKVHDRATAELMKRFYANLVAGKMPPDRALRAAQLELAREPRYRAPYYWSAFVISGELAREPSPRAIRP